MHARSLAGQATLRTDSMPVKQAENSRAVHASRTHAQSEVLSRTRIDMKAMLAAVLLLLLVDSNATIVNGKHCVLYLWYDNEFGYCCQVGRMVYKMAGVNYLAYPEDA